MSSAELLDQLQAGVFILTSPSPKEVSSNLAEASQPAKIVATNLVAQGWLGRTDEELKGTPLLRWLSLPDKVECPFLEGTGEKYPASHVAFLQANDGGDGRLKLRYHPLASGEVLCMATSFTEDLSLTKAHNDFVSTVSHEFRTPLTSIKGFADTMLRYGGNLPPDQQKRFINIIKEQADRLIRLVENLLSVSRLGAGRVQLTFRPVSLKRMVAKVIESLEGKGDFSRTFEVSMAESLPDIWVDPDQLEQILINLLDNAVKYSFDGTTIRVYARLDESDGERLIVSIADEGVGIDPTHQPKIFSKFSRIDNPLTREAEGTGLGLYITRSLTLSMDGTIELESEPGKGTTFILSFPIATLERQASYRRKLLDNAVELEGETGR